MLLSLSAQVHPISLVVRDTLQDAIAEFLLDREARGLSKRTVAWYGEQLRHLVAYLGAQGVADVAGITAPMLRAFILNLAQTHNPGGVHGAYRAARAFLNWYAAEYDAPNPIAKVAAPRMVQEPLEPVSIADVKAMLDTCERRTFTGDRDRALLLFLLDSGCRRAELLALDVADVNLKTGGVLVRHGKGNKARMTFIGAKTRKAVMAYLKHRGACGDGEGLWVSERGERLSPTALRALMVRRARVAGVRAPAPHAFRRAFAIGALRNGMDLVSLQRLLGHTSLAIVSRYLRQVEGDLAAAHQAAGLVDRML